MAWEPTQTVDYVDVGWSRLGDVAVHESKLLGCGIQNSSVHVWVVDLARRDADPQQRPFTRYARQSFSSGGWCALLCAPKRRVPVACSARCVLGSRARRLYLTTAGEGGGSPAGDGSAQGRTRSPTVPPRTAASSVSVAAEPRAMQRPTTTTTTTTTTTMADNVLPRATAPARTGVGLDRADDRAERILARAVSGRHGVPPPDSDTPARQAAASTAESSAAVPEHTPFQPHWEIYAPAAKETAATTATASTASAASSADAPPPPRSLEREAPSPLGFTAGPRTPPAAAGMSTVSRASVMRSPSPPPPPPQRSLRSPSPNASPEATATTSKVTVGTEMGQSLLLGFDALRLQEAARLLEGEVAAKLNHHQRDWTPLASSAVHDMAVGDKSPLPRSNDTGAPSSAVPSAGMCTRPRLAEWVKRHISSRGSHCLRST